MNAAWDWSMDGWILAAGVLSAGACALLGNFLVLRRMSLMGDAISHAVLPGLAIAFLVTQSRSAWPMLLGGVAAGAVTAVMTEAVHKFGKVEPGAAMGVTFSVLFALGLVLIRRAADSVDLDPDCVLYGNLDQIGFEGAVGGAPHAVIHLAVVFAANVLFVGLFYKELRISTFDPELATSLGISARVMHYALMILVSVTTVASFEAVGSILVIAMLIVPPVLAHLLTDRLGVMLPLSVALGATAAAAGQWAAQYGPGQLGIDYSVKTAAMIAVVAGAMLAVGVFLAPQRGLVSRAVHQWRLSLTIVREDILGLLLRWHELRPAEGRAIVREDILAAVGDTWMARWGIRSLVRRRELRLPVGGGLELTRGGESRAAGLVRSHRLWEAYLAEHFDIPLDHVHFSAERAEHFITPQLRRELDRDLTAPGVDPHGREIPPEREG
jgi:manganese/zinc/iron transport system permease protein